MTRTENYIYPSFVYNDPNDKINELKVLPRGCAHQNDVYKILAKYTPAMTDMANEYEYAGPYGHCYYCSGAAPKESDTSKKNFNCWTKDGKRASYKRVRYAGNKTICCLTGHQIVRDHNFDHNQTCDPKGLNPTSEFCKDGMVNGCFIENSDGSKIQIFDQLDMPVKHLGMHGKRGFYEPSVKKIISRCKEFCSTKYGKDICRHKLSNYCDRNLSNFNRPECRKFCIENPGSCDKMAMKYCEFDKNRKSKDKFCACLNSKFKDFKYNPLCQDNDCITYGYATTPMITARGSGCQIVDCSVVFDINAGQNVNFEDVEIVQKCQKEQAIKKVEAIDNKVKVQEVNNDNTTTIIVVGVGVVITAGIVVTVFLVVK